MAITKIHAIKSTPDLALDYVINDKVEYDYKTNTTTTYETLNSTLNCSLKNANVEMQNVREQYGKNDKNLLYHVIQNFGENVDPKIANEIGVKLAERLFSEYQCVISTHTNTEHTHNHIILNSTSFVDGKKYNDNLKTYAAIRKISDELCEEYGIKTLEKTKEMKLIKYKDDNGKTKFFEPTSRKQKIRDGQLSDANDYRNTKAFEAKEFDKKSNSQVIKEDIDRLLPYATSYDNLLKLLKESGYKIKAKTSNGEYRKHISFQGATQPKATRDSSLGEKYTREFLTSKIEENKISIAKNNGNEINVPIPSREEHLAEKEIYRLGRIDIDSLDENTRYNSDLKRNVMRSPAERSVVLNTKYLHYEYKLCIKAMVHLKPHDEPQDYKSRQLEKNINKNLSALYFMEQNNIQSFSQIIDMKKILLEKNSEIAATLVDIKESIVDINEKLSLIESYTNLKERIHNTTPGYIQMELANDTATLKKYEATLQKYNLLDDEMQKQYVAKAIKYKSIYTKLQKESKRINERISEYDKLVATVKTIDKDIGGYDFQADILHYNELDAKRKETENERETSNKRKEHER